MSLEDPRSLAWIGTWEFLLQKDYGYLQQYGGQVYEETQGEWTFLPNQALLQDKATIKIYLIDPLTGGKALLSQQETQPFIALWGTSYNTFRPNIGYYNLTIATSLISDIGLNIDPETGQGNYNATNGSDIKWEIGPYYEFTNTDTITTMDDVEDPYEIPGVFKKLGGPDQWHAGIYDTEITFSVDINADGWIGVPRGTGGNNSKNTIRSYQSRTLKNGESKLILEGNASINGSGNSLNNVIIGNKAANTLKGLNGNDRLNGKLGNDVLNGGRGRDTAVFSSRANRINLNTTKRQNTGDGRDRLISIENVIAGAGNDVIIGNKAANTLNGQKGNDRIFGRAGNDLLIGGGGRDRVWGQAGRDTFRIIKGAGYTIIEDFVNQEDRIHLGSGQSGLRMRERNDDVYVYLRKDLMAIVEDAAGVLQISGNYLV